MGSVVMMAVEEVGFAAAEAGPEAGMAAEEAETVAVMAVEEVGLAAAEAGPEAGMAAEEAETVGSRLPQGKVEVLGWVVVVETAAVGSVETVGSGVAAAVGLVEEAEAAG